MHAPDSVAPCPICSGTAADHARVQDALRSRLYRFTCPPAMVLAAYVVGALARCEHVGVSVHVRTCPRCAADEENLRDLLDDSCLR